jgi:tRNA1(Val) A37 N6-methylase TrmN6
MFPVVNILETSAGQGGLLQPIIEFYSDKEFMPKIDMVELDRENRNELSKYVEKAPDIFSLQKTTDFLEFIPNKEYNYIFMNPPFHLDSKLNKKYKKDYYDYDFVKRAYAMLEMNGVLVAITGTNYKKNQEILNWYEDKNAKITQVRGKWEGENLKKGSEIKNLERVFIVIRKISDDLKETKELLKIDDFNAS